jgi:hypothetical protein
VIHFHTNRPETLKKIMFDEITANQLPNDLDWKDVGEAPNTHLGATIQMWGITFNVDAFAIDEFR